MTSFIEHYNKERNLNLEIGKIVKEAVEKVDLPLEPSIEQNYASIMNHFETKIAFAGKAELSEIAENEYRISRLSELSEKKSYLKTSTDLFFDNLNFESKLGFGWTSSQLKDEIEGYVFEELRKSEIPIIIDHCAKACYDHIVKIAQKK